jgi:predicted nucleic acid-binding protein
MIVVDANILAYYHLDSDFSEMALDAFRRDPNWIAPLLWRSEFENILAGYLRRNLMPLPKATIIMEEAIAMMEETEFQVSARRVLDLVSNSTCSSYDCEYVALAKQFDVPLLTKDKRILAQFPDIAIRLEDFIA